MTARRKAALKKAQIASARKRKRGSYARRVDYIRKNGTRDEKLLMAFTTSPLVYHISKRRGQPKKPSSRKRILAKTVATGIGGAVVGAGVGYAITNGSTRGYMRYYARNPRTLARDLRRR